MNSEQYDKLSDEEKRIKVAESCGWYEKEIRPENSGTVYNAWFHKDKGHHCPTDLLPDYLHDLNSCHEFEEQLVICPLKYKHMLNAIVERDKIDWICDSIFATAEQRCKAFVLTMSKEEA